MNPALVTEDDLKVWLGIRTRAELLAWVARSRLKYTSGRRERISTTMDAVNIAIGVMREQEERAQDIEIL